MLWSPSSGPMAPGITPLLPGGNGAEFRARMTDWAAPEPVAMPPAAPVERTEPVALPRLSSRFGVRADPFRAVAAVHRGVDIPGALGTPVQASAPGVVRFAGRAGGYGTMIEIDHGGGLTTRYAHLARALVRPGEGVGRGDAIALMGSTGRSTGSHLHFEVRLGSRAVDPLRYLGSERLAAPQAKATPEPVHISAFARARDAARAQEPGS